MTTTKIPTILALTVILWVTSAVDGQDIEPVDANVAPTMKYLEGSGSGDDHVWAESGLVPREPATETEYTEYEDPDIIVMCWDSTIEVLTVGDSVGEDSDESDLADFMSWADESFLLAEEEELETFLIPNIEGVESFGSEGPGHTPNFVPDEISMVQISYYYLQGDDSTREALTVDESEDDVNGDGLVDLFVQVENQGFDDLGAGGSVELTGTTIDGVDIEGYDHLIIVRPEEECDIPDKP